jgi:hypothetical protein
MYFNQSIKKQKKLKPEVRIVYCIEAQPPHPSLNVIIKIFSKRRKDDKLAKA